MASLSSGQCCRLFLRLVITLLAIQTAHCAFGDPILVVFGRPGSGKTSIADAAIAVLRDQEAVSNEHDYVGLDLDVCVPPWMRENFARGRYPTLAERQQFALEACDYVEQQLNRRERTIAALVSFSFVNTDLRDTFRARFPHAKWALVDTSEEDAARRIQQREGHFYTGAPPTSTSASESDRNSGGDNSEWDFAPVTFPHIVLPGTATVEENAERIARVLQETFQD